MQAADADAFNALLADVAECMGHRPISARATVHWFDALREHPFPRVRSVLKGWMVTRHKLPTIADICRECAELAAADRERIAKAEAAAFDRTPDYRGPSEIGRRAMREIRSFLREGQRQPGKWWAREIVQAHEAGLPHPRTGRDLTDWQVRMAQAALGQLAVLSGSAADDGAWEETA